MSTFIDIHNETYKYRYGGRLHFLSPIVGGTPSDPRTAEAWLRTKISAPDDIIRSQVADIMNERGVSEEEAVRIANEYKHLNGFKRDENTRELYLDGRCLKACIKEAANIRWPKERWGVSNKGTMGFFAEHVFVPELRLYLGTTTPEVLQQFVHTWRGNGIQYAEYVEDAKMNFTVITDFQFTEEQWGQLWVTAEQQGLGAMRSQGYGRFEVIEWKRLRQRRG